MAAVTICSDFGAQKIKVSHCFHVSPSICHEVMGLDAMILVFCMLSFKSTFSGAPTDTKIQEKTYCIEYWKFAKKVQVLSPQRKKG